MESRQPIVAVDFDGTITESHTFPEIVGEPREMLVTYLREWHTKGVIIILFTCREDYLLELAEEYCKYFDIPIDFVNENADYVEPKMRKVFADFYIDDKGLYPTEENLKLIDAELKSKTLEPWVYIDFKNCKIIEKVEVD